MIENSVTLTIEELAFAIGVLGGMEAGGSFLVASLGQRSRDELQGRLYAASHSLLARKMMVIDGDKSSLSSDLKHVVLPMVEHDFSIRCSRTLAASEQTVGYFFTPSAILEHRTEQGVVCVLRMVDAKDDVLKLSRGLFDLDSSTGELDNPAPMGRIPADILDLARVRLTHSATDAMKALTDSGLDKMTAQSFIKDIQDAEYRGCLVRFDTANGQVSADRGFLLLKADDRVWTMKISSGTQPVLTLNQDMGQNFGVLLSELMA